MSSARRPLLTATAAATLLCALWFVPSANATADGPARTAPSANPSPQVMTQARVASAQAAASGSETRLADTGSFDTTPYVLGGTVFLTLGAGFVAYSIRRERLGF
ncbi:LPXTG cell wall anchor domain-containing protein [Streptomyces sp. S.PNR 29]|uniref:LPXTG cell wall anchor domain-containing protein n=1 Tax=Streptomyces sp. S.PNR 29 TaxID=2973805 RepID=UPI0025B21A47|nr:LPXTG cell wall anchor domain-containing protein [Streptomyces sp. S.PNR 29]MDN0195385.1 LPXTG cell wall anchor domain-containing protein [Streptomyces sp. S.PNR 29]